MIKMINNVKINRKNIKIDYIILDKIKIINIVNPDRLNDISNDIKVKLLISNSYGFTINNVSSINNCGYFQINNITTKNG